MRSTFVGLLLALCSVSPSALATPYPATWRREVLFGTNDGSYFTYLMERDYPGSHYEYTDSVFLLRYSLRTGEILEKRLVRKTRHVDEAADGNWKAVEQAVAPFCSEGYLLDARVEPAFPADDHPTETSPGGHALEVTPQGIFLSSGTDRVALMSEEALKERLSSLERPRIVERFHERGCRFLVIRSGADCSDTDFWEVVCKIDDASIEKAVKSLDARGGAPRPLAQDGGSAPPTGLAGGVYIVRKGDTLYGIAKAVYGKGSLYKLIADANPDLAASSLKVGQELKIPAIAGGGEPQRPAASAGAPVAEPRGAPASPTDPPR